MRVQHHLAGYDFWVRAESPSDLAVIKECWEDDTYRLAEVGVAPRTVVDIGANIGAFAIRVAVLWPRARILAFEPEPDNYELLCANVAANGLAGRIAPIRMAIGGSGRFYVNSAYGKSRVSDDPSWGEPVECRTLAEAFAAEEISRCDILKIDAEGAEYRILTGAPGDVMRRIGYLCMEYHRTSDDFGSRLGGLLTRLQEDFDLSVRAYTTMPALPQGTVHGAGMVFGRPNRRLGERELLVEGRADDQGKAGLLFRTPDDQSAYRVTGAAVRSTSATTSQCTLSIPGRSPGAVSRLAMDNGDFAVRTGLDIALAAGNTVGMSWTGLSAGAAVVGKLICAVPDPVPDPAPDPAPEAVPDAVPDS